MGPKGKQNLTPDSNLTIKGSGNFRQKLILILKIKITFKIID